ncbi:DUF4360 domain-containing protein [Jidongwangia harbinensis]|uniref:DUF4360 domain-containing protein n=1 Tax=Jidongwangia harbinensis TaxID=2878561 RepID=UPI001CDA47BE|nr:DUF4360 domain-containing protein [Jidongwangia harbinensis]MCA2215713.1 DUF4360 domain-containing protein [Jidongwangia harbinensis]
MVGALTVGGLLASLLVAPLAGRPADDPSIPAERLKVTVVTTNGSGCTAPALMTASVSEDNSAFTVTFGPEYRAGVGTPLRPADARKNCELNVVLEPPAGFTFAFSASRLSGSGTLAAGATGAARWHTYFAGQSQTTYRAHRLAGPFDGPWTAGAVHAPEALIWHPCGELRNDNFSTEVRVSAGTSDPAATTSFVSLESSTTDLIWRPCPVT